MLIYLIISSNSRNPRQYNMLFYMDSRFLLLFPFNHGYSSRSPASHSIRTICKNCLFAFFQPYLQSFQAVIIPLINLKSIFMISFDPHTLFYIKLWKTAIIKECLIWFVSLVENMRYISDFGSAASSMKRIL